MLTMTELEIARRIESAFRAFGYEMPFDSDSVRQRPAESIIEGLDKLQCISAINENTRKEHAWIYAGWGEIPLREVMENSICMDQIDALLRNLEDWKKEYSNKLE